MCDPISISAAAVAVGGTAVSAIAQNQRSAANANNATSALTTDYNQIVLREQQEQDATSLNITNAQKQGRSAASAARLGAAGNGVSGSSVDQVQGNISRRVSDYSDAQKQDLAMKLQQLQMTGKADQAQAESRINSVPPANPLATAVGLGGDLLGSFTNHLRMQPNVDGGTNG